MELTHPSTTPTSTSTSTSHFIHPTYIHQHITRLRQTHKSSSSKFFTFFALKTPLLQQPTYNHAIFPTPKPKQTNHNLINSKNNTTLDVLRLMDGLGLIVSPDIYASLVEECTRNRDAVQALEIFAHMKRNARMVKYLSLASGLFLFNRVLFLFVRCGCFDVARQVFDEMRHRNFVSLAILLGGFIDNENFEEALVLFVKLHRCFIEVYEKGEFDLGLEVVVVCVFKACVHLKMANLGKMVHGWLIKLGYNRWLISDIWKLQRSIGREKKKGKGREQRSERENVKGENDGRIDIHRYQMSTQSLYRRLLVDTALVDFYGKSGCLWEANRVFFDSIRVVDHRNTVIWTSAIVNNCRGLCFREVIRIFQEMGEAGVRTNEYIISSVLKACGRIGDDGSLGQQVHAKALKLAVDTHVFVVCALIDMYGRCGFLEEARKVFDKIDHGKRNSACWSAMVTSYMNHGLYIEALKMLYRMKGAGLEPKKSMIDEVRLACGSLQF